MNLIDEITSKNNLNNAYKRIVDNKGTSGVNGITVQELGEYIKNNRDTIVYSIRTRIYFPKLVKRVIFQKVMASSEHLGFSLH